MKKYRLTDSNKFLSELHKIVDTNVSMDNLKINPWQKTGEYIGSIKWGYLKVFGYGKFLFGRRLILKVTGDIKNNELTLRYNFKGLIYFILQIVFGLWFSIILFYQFLWPGILIFALLVFQIIKTLTSYYRCKEKLNSKIEAIINTA